MSLVYYILIICIIIYFCFKIYIKIKFGFWTYQPVVHRYNCFYWMFNNRIINNELPNTDRYCNFLNIITTDFEERNEETLTEITDFINTNFINTNFNNSFSNYKPTSSSFSSYFIGNNSKSLISTYYRPTMEIKNIGEMPINKNKLLGIITSRPLNITLQGKLISKVNYVENLCIDNEYRKQGIAAELIQTHNYVCRRKNKDIQVSLFKHEGAERLKGIIPLISYKTYQFHIRKIPKWTIPHASMKLIEINNQNIRLLTTFIYSQREKFDCIGLPDLTNILNLIKNNIYKIYAIIQTDQLICCYFFKQGYTHYGNDINNLYTSNEFIGSITNCLDNEIFVKGFTKALYKLYKITKSQHITIENISHNNIIINYIFSLNILPKIESQTAYYFYNYAKRTIISEKGLILC